ncbi:MULTISPECIES: ABC transporter ATP-binding protein [Ochrobactrum]|jgi:spermidine/putrescine transport system ATP-binding protein|uniref:ABC transporter ATP-binding protein n=1 Tax=Ochrobactrum quorumnocens TaxID=271865 RepID=A0A5N1K144_9HYPH|nr:MULTISPECIES: ABC transporter ATP-binding protein [Brucella/Ochrobactrum group]KAA9368281.1 ABC transporter ATP-binding protein [[Ochrobactrum] quorumnocens]MBD7991819.1 ABC transporter ATP-binding protein [Ochrobactrum gallinarum]MDH7792479.1 spermidine/putrescine transport system ATP-binding protein [Ochrobactrum sp. AN78]
MANYIEVRNLTKRYADYVALNDVSLAIAEGEFLALLGPSGCGKTTLLRSIAGFVDNVAGEILIDGRSMRDLPPNRRPVNTVFQNYALFPHMTVADNVAYGPRRNGASRKAAAELAEESLTTVGMADFRLRYPTQLSGGQQQRVALARAIANRPKVLLLDEPLGALDLKLRKQMQIELKALQHQLGMTFIFVTHDQEEALVMADRIAVMEAGRIVQVGSGRDIYHKPATRYVADFIGDANLIECRIALNGFLETVIGNIAIPAGAAGAVGSTVTYLVRPEAIVLSTDALPAKPQTIGLTATIQDIVFVGNATRVYAQTQGQVFICQFPSSVQPASLSTGQTVMLRWNPDSGQVLAS